VRTPAGGHRFAAPAASACREFLVLVLHSQADKPLRWRRPRYLGICAGVRRLHQASRGYTGRGRCRELPARRPLGHTAGSPFHPPPPAPPVHTCHTHTHAHTHTPPVHTCPSSVVSPRAPIQLQLGPSTALLFLPLLPPPTSLPRDSLLQSPTPSRAWRRCLSSWRRAPSTTQTLCACTPSAAASTSSSCCGSPRRETPSRARRAVSGGRAAECFQGQGGHGEALGEGAGEGSARRRGTLATRGTLPRLRVSSIFPPPLAASSSLRLQRPSSSASPSSSSPRTATCAASCTSSCGPLRRARRQAGEGAGRTGGCTRLQAASRGLAGDCFCRCCCCEGPAKSRARPPAALVVTLRHCCAPTPSSPARLQPHASASLTPSCSPSLSLCLSAASSS